MKTKNLLIKSLILIFLFQLLPVRPVFAAGITYYVSTVGNNSNPGTISRPWKTIQKAANVAGAGDIVYVRGGTYQEKVIVQNSGTEGNYITFSSYPGEKAIISGSGVSFSDYHEGGFVINNKRYIEVTGFTITNIGYTTVSGSIAGGFGIVCYQSEYCTIRNNRTYNTYRSGIVVRSSNYVTVDGNDVELANNDGDREMIAISGGSFINVTNNKVHNGGPGINGGEGINIYNGAHDVLVKGNNVYDISRVGIYIDAYDNNTYNITVDSNVVHHNVRSGIAVEAENTGGWLDNILVTNNLVYKNMRTGIILGDWGVGQLSNIYFINNTVAMNGTGESGGGIALWNTRANNVVVQNNIFSQNKSFTIEVNGTPIQETTISHNLLDGFRNLDTEVRGSSYVEASAGFYNAGIFDFKLLPSSPAINNGTEVNAPIYDILNYPRIVVDIGAYEYDPSAPAPLTSVFFDRFDGAFSGWTRSGKVTWAAVAPRKGAHSIHLTGNASVSHLISTQGFETLTLDIYLGAKSYESKEKLQIAWWNGSSWKTIYTIANGSLKENGKLNHIIIPLPPEAANLSSFKIRIRQLSSDIEDYGYIDSVQLKGYVIP